MTRVLHTYSHAASRALARAERRALSQIARKALADRWPDAAGGFLDGAQLALPPDVAAGHGYHRLKVARLAHLPQELRKGKRFVCWREEIRDGKRPRFQLLIWPDTSCDWDYRDELPNGEAIKQAEEVCRRIAAMDVDDPPTLKFTPEAQQLFIQWLTGLEMRLREDELSHIMQAHLAKYRSLMPSLALLFSLADGKTDAVGLAHAQQAADWCEYLEQHANRIYASRISPERLAALSLAKKLHNGWPRDKETGRPSEKFTVRQVYINDWTGLGTPEEVRVALRVLEEAGWVREEALANKTGRPSAVYLISNQHMDATYQLPTDESQKYLGVAKSEPSKPSIFLFCAVLRVLRVRFRDSRQYFGGQINHED
jgi:hypothetical protein